MDLVSGLSAASTALGIVKDLREIDRSVDEAGFKLKLAELTEALADARIALSDAKGEIAEKNSEIRLLKDALASAKLGETCPICNDGNLKVSSVTPHRQLGAVGVQERKLRCDNESCRHTEARLHDPNGMLKK